MTNHMHAFIVMRCIRTATECALLSQSVCHRSSRVSFHIRFPRWGYNETIQTQALWHSIERFIVPPEIVTEISHGHQRSFLDEPIARSVWSQAGLGAGDSAAKRIGLILDERRQLKWSSASNNLWSTSSVFYTTSSHICRLMQIYQLSSLWTETGMQSNIHPFSNPMYMDCEKLSLRQTLCLCFVFDVFKNSSSLLAKEDKERFHRCRK